MGELNIAVGEHDLVFDEMVGAAQIRWGFSAAVARDVVTSVALFWVSDQTSPRCTDQAAVAAAKHLVSAYAGAPTHDLLAAAVAHWDVRSRGAITEPVQDAVLGAEDPCATAVVLREAGGRFQLVEPAIQACATSSRFLEMLARSRRVPDLLKAEILSRAWRECPGGPECAALLERASDSLLEFGLAERAIALLETDTEEPDSSRSMSRAVGLVMMGSLSEAAEVLERLEEQGRSPCQADEDGESPETIHRAVCELLLKGRLSTGTVIEGVVNYPSHRLDWLELLMDSPIPQLRSTRAFAAWQRVEGLTRSVEAARRGAQATPGLEVFSAIVPEAEVALRDARHELSELLIGLEGSLSFQPTHTSTAVGGDEECSGVHPEWVPTLCGADAADVSDDQCRFVVSGTFVTPEHRALWALCPQGGATQRALLGVRGQGPFRSVDGEEPPGPLSLACVEAAGSTVSVRYADQTSGFSLDRLLNDGDGDGLSWSLEGFLGTDTGSADTDGDGVDDASDPVPSFVTAPSDEAAWLPGARALLGPLWEAFTRVQREAHPCDPLGGTLFVETVDKELVGAVAEVLDRRVVPLFPHEVTPEVVPMSSEAHFRIEMLGVDAEAGLAFISYAWGGGPAGGALVLKHIDGAWVSIYGQR